MMTTTTLATTDTDIAAAWPVMSQLRPHIPESDFVSTVRAAQALGYQLALHREDGNVVAVAGFRILHQLVRGRVLYVDDLVTDASTRSHGHGHNLLAWLIEQARSEQCAALELDSGVQRHDAHRFYLRERMRIASYHFVLDLQVGREAVPPSGS